MRRFVFIQSIREKALNFPIFFLIYFVSDVQVCVDLATGEEGWHFKVTEGQDHGGEVYVV
jgi:hypothetical protein